MSIECIEEINSTVLDDAMPYHEIWNILIEIEKDNIENSFDINLIGRICSMSLSPSNYENPYRPFMTWGEKRSAILEDFSEIEIGRLDELADQITNKKILSRIYDVLWIIIRPRKIEYARNAIENYAKIIKFDSSWHDDGKEMLERFISICMYAGNSCKSNLDGMIEKVRKDLDSENPEQYLQIIDVCRIFFKIMPRSKFTLEIAESCAKIGKKLFSEKESFRARHFLEQASIVYEKSKKLDEWVESLVMIADCYQLEIQQRPGSSLIENHFYEEQIHVLRKIPKKFREKYAINKRMEELTHLLHESGKQSIYEMGNVSTGPVDISELIEQATSLVKDKDIHAALVNFANISISPDPEKLRKDAIEQIKKFPLSNLFSNRFSSSDGARTIGKSAGSDTNNPDESNLQSIMMRNYLLQVHLTVSGYILPALEIISNEHRITEDDFVALAIHSRFIPSDRAQIIGKGLYFGYCGDFCSSLYILTPQIEHLVRVHLHTRGQKTSKVDENGIDTENGLSTLMKIEATEEIFGKGLCFELKCIFTEPLGSNLRNQCAHGLLSYEESRSSPSVYAWWLAFKMVYNTFRSTNEKT